MAIINKIQINQIIKETDIVDLISEDLDLVKKGSNFVGLCPFHADNNPSFTVNPEKKIYKCFVCNNGGNVISYLQNKKQISFEEAIKILALRSGIKLMNEPSKRKTSNEYLLEDILVFYNTILVTMQSGKIARDYLSDIRKYEFEHLTRFKLGYSASTSNLLKYLNLQIEENHRYDSFDIEQIKIANEKYDFFNKRLVIPIFNDEGQVVGFSGRTITNQEPKYLNSKESEIFQKKSILYNLNNAKKFLVDDTLYLVEGFFDVWALGKIGINNSVGIMGTAFTIEHIKLLKKYRIKKIILCLDQDEAGFNAAIAIGTRLINNKIIDLEVIQYSEIKDIDELVKLKSTEQVMKYFDSKIDFYQFKINYIKEKYNLSTIDGKSEFLKLALVGLENLTIEKKNVIIALIASLVAMSSEQIMQLVKNNQISNKSPYDYIEKKKESFQQFSLPNDEEAAICYSLQSKANFEKVKKHIEKKEFRFTKLKELFMSLDDYYQQFDNFDVIDFIDINKSEISFEEIERLDKVNMIDLKKIDLIFGKKKHKIPGRDFFRRRT